MKHRLLVDNTTGQQVLPCIGGPLDGKTACIPAGMPMFCVHHQIIRPTPDAIEIAHDHPVHYAVYPYRYRRHPFLLEFWVALFQGIDGSKMEPPVGPYSCFRLFEVVPDFLDEFDQWMDRQIAIHCPWTWKAIEREHVSLGMSRYITGEPDLIADELFFAECVSQ